MRRVHKIAQCDDRTQDPYSVYGVLSDGHVQPPVQQLRDKFAVHERRESAEIWIALLNHSHFFRGSRDAMSCGFLGGEPLLNKDICSFMRAARESGVFRNIRVITNGLLLSKMSEEFWQLADIVRISVYPATADMLFGSETGIV